LLLTSIERRRLDYYAFAMIFIFGTRGRLSTMDGGQFYCPRCGGDRDYTRKGVRRWFTLFFIPIVPMGATRNVRIVCSTCDGAFNEQVLTMPSGSAFEEIERRAFRQCAEAVLKAGNPQSRAARDVLLRAVNQWRGTGGELDDATLDQEITGIEPGNVAVYAGPLATRLPAAKSEQFFGGCASVALADGEPTPDQQGVLRNLGETFNLTEAHQRGVLDVLRSSHSEHALGEAGTS
jgi:transposase-like protein